MMNASIDGRGFTKSLDNIFGFGNCYHSNVKMYKQINFNILLFLCKSKQWLDSQIFDYTCGSMHSKDLEDVEFFWQCRI
jgi:hypothetical protein